MKTPYTILRDELQPPVESKELATFTWMLHQSSGLDTAGLLIADTGGDGLLIVQRDPAIHQG